MCPHLIDSPGVFGTEILHFFFFSILSYLAKMRAFVPYQSKLLNPEGTLANNF